MFSHKLFLHLLIFLVFLVNMNPSNSLPSFEVHTVAFTSTTTIATTVFVTIINNTTAPHPPSLPPLLWLMPPPLSPPPSPILALWSSPPPPSPKPPPAGAVAVLASWAVSYFRHLRCPSLLLGLESRTEKVEVFSRRHKWECCHEETQRYKAPPWIHYLKLTLYAHSPRLNYLLYMAF